MIDSEVLHRTTWVRRLLARWDCVATRLSQSQSLLVSCRRRLPSLSPIADGVQGGLGVGIAPLLVSLFCRRRTDYDQNRIVGYLKCPTIGYSEFYPMINS